MLVEVDWARFQSQTRRGRDELLDIVIVTRRERPCTRANNSALVVLGLDASTLNHNAAMLIALSCGIDSVHIALVAAFGHAHKVRTTLLSVDLAYLYYAEPKWSAGQHGARTRGTSSATISRAVSPVGGSLIPVVISRLLSGSWT